MSKQLIIIFCTSNTCRSPMAEGFAKQWLSEHNLDDYVVESRSLTTDYEPIGSPPSKHGECLMREIYGLDISKHRSKLLSAEDVHDAKWLIGVSKSHAYAVQRMFRDVDSSKLLSFNRDISDPWHSDRKTYEKCAVMIKGAIDATLSELLLSSVE